MDAIMADIVALAAISGVNTEIFVARPQPRPQPRADPDPRGWGRGRGRPFMQRLSPFQTLKSKAICLGFWYYVCGKILVQNI